MDSILVLFVTEYALSDLDLATGACYARALSRADKVFPPYEKKGATWREVDISHDFDGRLLLTINLYRPAD